MLSLLSNLTVELIALIVLFGIILVILEWTKPPRVVAPVPSSDGLYYDPVVVHRMETQNDPHFQASFDAPVFQAQLQNLIQKVELLHLRLNSIEQRLEDLPRRIQSNETLSISTKTPSSGELLHA